MQALPSILSSSPSVSANSRANADNSSDQSQQKDNSAFGKAVDAPASNANTQAAAQNANAQKQPDTKTQTDASSKNTQDAGATSAEMKNKKDTKDNSKDSQIQATIAAVTAIILVTNQVTAVDPQTNVQSNSTNATPIVPADPTAATPLPLPVVVTTPTDTTPVDTTDNNAPPANAPPAANFSDVLAQTIGKAVPNNSDATPSLPTTSDAASTPTSSQPAQLPANADSGVQNNPPASPQYSPPTQTNMPKPQADNQPADPTIKAPVTAQAIAPTKNTAPVTLKPSDIKTDSIKTTGTRTDVPTATQQQPLDGGEILNFLQANDNSKTDDATNDNAKSITVIDTPDVNSFILTDSKTTHSAAPIADKLQATTSHASPIDQVTVQIKTLAANGSNTIKIQLDPENLGKVEVQLNISADGKTNVSVLADSRNTLDMLQQGARQLEQALRDIGLKTDTGGLNFNLRDQGQQQQPKFAANAYTQVAAADESSQEYYSTVSQIYRVQQSDSVDIRV